MAAGAAVPQHRHQGEGEFGPGGDQLRLAARHPHHHTALAHARGTPETPRCPHASSTKLEHCWCVFLHQISQLWMLTLFCDKG